MKYSEPLAAFVKRWEGLRLQKYFCSAGRPTIGWGHAFTPSEPQPDEITLEQAEAYFAADIAEHAQAVDELVTVDLAQHEFDALCSWCFNLGADRLKRSTLLRKVNDRRFDDAAHEFGRWVYAGPRIEPGLVKRRKAEQAMFESADYSGAP